MKLKLFLAAAMACVATVSGERKKDQAIELVGKGYCRREDCEIPCLQETLLEYMPMCATFEECKDKCIDVLTCVGFAYTQDPTLDRDGCISLELGHCIITFSKDDLKVGGTTTTKKTDHYDCYSFDRSLLESEDEEATVQGITQEEIMVTVISLGSLLFVSLVACAYYYNQHRKESERMRRMAYNSAILGNTKSPVLQHLQQQYHDLPNQKKHGGKKNHKQIAQAKKLAKQRAKEKNVREVKKLHEEHLQNAAKQHEVHSIEHALQTMKFEEALGQRRQARRNKGKKKKKKGDKDEDDTDTMDLMEEAKKNDETVQMMDSLQDKDQHDKLAKKLQKRNEKREKKKAKLEFVDDE